MYIVSLTSIPPRFGRLGPVLDSLLAQEPAPSAVILCLPRAYRRFPGPIVPPALPDGVTLLRADTDLGPASKAVPAARAHVGRLKRLVWCDDDWIYPPHWARALLSAAAPGVATTGQAWGVERIGRQGTGADIAQGFSGVSVDPAWIAGPEADPPGDVQAVDDIWLSGQLARQGIALREVPQARDGMIPAFADAHGLQDSGGRDAANRACAALLHERYGIWPLRTGP